MAAPVSSAEAEWKSRCLPLLEELSLDSHGDAKGATGGNTWSEIRVKESISDGSLLENILTAIGENKETLRQESELGKVDKLCARIGLRQKSSSSNPSPSPSLSSPFGMPSSMPPALPLDEMVQKNRENFIQVFVAHREAGNENIDPNVETVPNSTLESSTEDVDWFGLFKCIQYIRSFLQSTNLLSKDSVTATPVRVRPTSREPSGEAGGPPDSFGYRVSRLLSPALTTPIPTGPLSRLGQIDETHASVGRPIGTERVNLSRVSRLWGEYAGTRTSKMGSMTPGPNVGRAKTRLSSRAQAERDALAKQRIVEANTVNTSVLAPLSDVSNVNETPTHTHPCKMVTDCDGDSMSPPLTFQRANGDEAEEMSADVDVTELYTQYLFIKKLNAMYEKEVQVRSNSLRAAQTQLHTEWDQKEELQRELTSTKRKLEEYQMKLTEKDKSDAKIMDNIGSLKTERISLMQQLQKERETVSKMVAQYEELKKLHESADRKCGELAMAVETEVSKNETTEMRNRSLKAKISVMESRKYLDSYSIGKIREIKDCLKNSARRNTQLKSEIQSQCREFSKFLNEMQADSKRKIGRMTSKIRSTVSYVPAPATIAPASVDTRSDEMKTVDEYMSLERVLERHLEEKDTLLMEVDHIRSLFSEKCEENKQLNEQLIDLKGNIRVFCRIRPKVSRKDTEKNGPETKSAIVSCDGESLQIQERTQSGCNIRAFEYDHIFGTRSRQEDVFAEVVPLIRSCMNGYNVCVFAYGQTGSGKTYTMEGCPGKEGVIYRSINELFRLVQALENEYEVSNDEKDVSIDLYLSILEVYNEKIQDLLRDRSNPKTTSSYRIKMTEQNRVYVDGLRRVKVTNSDEIHHYLNNVANSNRSTGVTNMNEHSSRSHAVVSVDVEKSIGDGDGDESEERILLSSSRLVLIDLAGSERIKRSQVVGRALEEAKNINKSLAALGNVMAALQNKSKHIPFRDSTLTYLLSDCLGGSAKALMFSNISCEMDDCKESVNTLQFASRVRSVELGTAKRGASMSNKGNDAWKNKIARLKSDHEQQMSAVKAQMTKFKKQQTTFASRSKETATKISGFENEIKRLQTALKNANSRCNSLQAAGGNGRNKRPVTAPTQSTINKRQRKPVSSPTPEAASSPTPPAPTAPSGTVRRSKRLERKRKRPDDDDQENQPETKRARRTRYERNRANQHKSKSAHVSSSAIARTRRSSAAVTARTARKQSASVASRRRKVRSKSTDTKRKGARGVRTRTSTANTRTKKKTVGNGRKRTLKEVDGRDEKDDEDLPAAKKRKIDRSVKKEPEECNGVEDMDVDEEENENNEEENEKEDVLSDLQVLKAKIASRAMRRKRSIVHTVESIEKLVVENPDHEFVSTLSPIDEQKTKPKRGRLSMQPKTVQSVMKELYQGQKM